LMINMHGQGPPTDLTPPGIEIANGKFGFQGSHTLPGKFSIEWDIEADPDPFLHLTLSLTNLMSVAQNFTQTITLPVSPQIIGGSLTGGSVSGTLTDTGGGGAQLRTISTGAPIYMSRIDGTDHKPLMTAPQSFTTIPYGTTGFGPDDFGTPIPTLAGPDVLTDIEIEINFELSGNDFAAIGATFVVVPEPGTLVLVSLGAVGILFRPRRA